jgi:RND superfamily putative drug exporter
MQAAVSAVQQQNPGLSIREAGDITVDDAINQRVADDLGSAETISLPLTLILMLLAFGALVAAGIPVLLAGTSVAVTIGLSAPISHLIHAEPTVTSMIVLIGMAVGVDYSLFYLKRERAERAAGRTTLDAVEIAAQTSGHSILVSGSAVIISMTGLFIMGGATFNSLAAGSIVVVAVAVLGSITVLLGDGGAVRLKVTRSIAVRRRSRRRPLAAIEPTLPRIACRISLGKPLSQ